ncbi:hypothetical protein SCOR_33015 [Sulfidibacter corallicola]|uniref:Uncharacterized protein n=1 Tax=Sulfidibacter corallicola TaxID=2818388 RepID=A0A8A4TJH1_SULCO|nr:hypothetical protein [Sulfidibacter corallicola]QTD49637.1 hypothetical protein J3U87_28985 [Sulfidibacter corallicola]
MPKNKSSRRKKAKAASTKPATTSHIPTDLFHKYYLSLLEGQEANAGHFAYWDLGSGERPQKVKVDFERVAHKEGIVARVLLASGGQSLRFAYLESEIPIVGVRVLDKDGNVKFRQVLEAAESIPQVRV